VVVPARRRLLELRRRFPPHVQVRPRRRSRRASGRAPGRCRHLLQQVGSLVEVHAVLDRVHALLDRDLGARDALGVSRNSVSLAVGFLDQGRDLGAGQLGWVGVFQLDAAGWAIGRSTFTCAWESISPGVSVRPASSITAAPSGTPSAARLTWAIVPFSTSTPECSRTGPPVPSNSRPPVSQSRPGAGGGSASKEGSRAGTTRG